MSEVEWTRPLQNKNPKPNYVKYSKISNVKTLGVFYSKFVTCNKMYFKIVLKYVAQNKSPTLSNFQPVRSAPKTEVHFVPYFFLVQPTTICCNCV